MKNPYSEAVKLAASFFANVAVALLSIGVIAPMIAAHNFEIAPTSAWCIILAFWFLGAAVLIALQAK
jgi:predicted ABC-type exoprotein transport system permease subunit